jgi:hypothetical protein
MVRMYRCARADRAGMLAAMRFSVVVALTELLGVLVGLLLAPLVALRSRLRRQHFFHAQGRVLQAEVVSPQLDALPAELRPLAQAIVGQARVRFSWAAPPHKAGRPDQKRPSNILGLGLQLGDPQWPQHLLLATFRFRKRRTAANPDDFLDRGNVYASVLPYRLRQVGDVYLQVRSLRQGPGRGSAIERLERATEADQDHLSLELAAAADRERWICVGTIRLRRLLPAAAAAPGAVTDDPTRSPALSPQRSAAGLRTVGFFAGVRRVVYPVSQWGRRPPPAAQRQATTPIRPRT